MSWVNCTDQELCTFLQGLAVGCLPTLSSDTNASVPSKLTTIASKPWSKGKKTGVFPGFRFLMTLNLLTGNSGESSLTSWQPGFRVNPTVLLESKKGKTMNETYGLTRSASFAKLSHDVCYSKTFLGSSIHTPTSAAVESPIRKYRTKKAMKTQPKHPKEFVQTVVAEWVTPQLNLFSILERYSETWPKQGIMLDGIAYRQQPVVLCIEEIGLGLWGTPRTCSSMAAQLSKKMAMHKFPNLETQVAKTIWHTNESLDSEVLQGKATEVWPTLTQWDYKDGSAESCKNVPVNALLGRSVHDKTCTLQAYPTPLQYNATPGGPNNHYKGLGHMAKHKWPTPTTADQVAGESRLRGDYKRYRGIDLATAAVLSNKTCHKVQETWPAPRSQMVRKAIHDKGKCNLEEVVAGLQHRSLSPDWTELLMGWPKGWSSLAPMDIKEYDKWLVGFTSEQQEDSSLNTIYPLYGVKAWAEGTWETTVPRVATNIPDRINRLKAIGNGQVPICVAMAWMMLNMENNGTEEMR